MPRTNTPDPDGFTLIVNTRQRLTIKVESQPGPCTGMGPFWAEFRFLPGKHSVSLGGSALHKSSNTAENCERTPEIFENSAAITSPPDNVLEGSHHHRSPCFPNSPTGRYDGININRTASCIVRGNGRAQSTVADSEDDDDPPPRSSVVTPTAAQILPTAADPASGHPTSPSELLRKRRHNESIGDESEGSNMFKRKCTSGRQDGSSSV
jgi:hypothetical protein